MATLSYIDRTCSEDTTITMRLYGTIGEKVDGDYFAQELCAVARDCELIKLRLNSPGGDVISGMSIVSAILSLDTPIYIYVDGIAASMSAVIAVCGDKVYMADYAKMMIHDPYFAGVEAPTAKDKKRLAKVREMLTQVLSRRGKDAAEVATLMASETWYSSQEALQNGLCDEVISTKRPSMATLPPMRICALVDHDYDNTQKNNVKMKLNQKAAELLGVTAEASEADISAAIERSLLGKATSESVVTKALEAQHKAERELQEIQERQAKSRKEQADKLVEAAIKDGRINAKGKASLMSMFAQNYEAALETLEAIPPRVTIASQIGGAQAEEALTTKSWDELDKQGCLGTLKSKYPDIYRDKFNARFHPQVD